ncbi:hypothetical protein PGT21_002722 [Puccinia graminis f. sp. tritici]|uniref:Uncharacterized protein n=1 Tax=Puccinia graminis f. sp. tritici TaxID=56615 RepID=A0A5B0M8S6_PUCGR|nr:hypothetical protein PGT21_002722 [Puccinia graminis f. sp. tritici]
MSGMMWRPPKVKPALTAGTTTKTKKIYKSSPEANPTAFAAALDLRPKNDVNLSPDEFKCLSFLRVQRVMFIHSAQSWVESISHAAAGAAILYDKLVQIDQQQGPDEPPVMIPKTKTPRSFSDQDWIVLAKEFNRWPFRPRLARYVYLVDWKGTLPVSEVHASPAGRQPFQSTRYMPHQLEGPCRLEGNPSSRPLVSGIPGDTRISAGIWGGKRTSAPESAGPGGYPPADSGYPQRIIPAHLYPTLKNKVDVFAIPTQSALGAVIYKDTAIAPPSDNQQAAVQNPEKFYLTEGDLVYAIGTVTNHNSVGFAPFLDENIRKLRSPLLLTIFNRKWQQRAMAHHLDRRQRSEDLSSDKEKVGGYKGFAFVQEWTQTYAQWTRNHRAFRKTLHDVYKIIKFSKLLATHKNNCDDITEEFGFMVVFRYDMEVRSNTFSHRITDEDVKNAIPDIS